MVLLLCIVLGSQFGKKREKRKSKESGRASEEEGFSLFSYLFLTGSEVSIQEPRGIT